MVWLAPSWPGGGVWNKHLDKTGGRSLPVPCTTPSTPATQHHVAGRFDRPSPTDCGCAEIAQAEAMLNGRRCSALEGHHAAGVDCSTGHRRTGVADDDHGSVAEGPDQAPGLAPTGQSASMSRACSACIRRISRGSVWPSAAPCPTRGHPPRKRSAVGVVDEVGGQADRAVRVGPRSYSSVGSSTTAVAPTTRPGVTGTTQYGCERSAKPKKGQVDARGPASGARSGRFVMVTVRWWGAASLASIDSPTVRTSGCS